MRSLNKRLGGGDLRSIGDADGVAAEASGNPARVDTLVEAIFAAEPVVRMRCADALEKISRVRPEYFISHRKSIIELLQGEHSKEILWHLLQISGRLQWTATQASTVFKTAEKCLNHPSSIVKTSAMQTLYDLLSLAPDKRKLVIQILSKQVRTGTPAMKARGRKLLIKLTGR